VPVAISSSKRLQILLHHIVARLVLSGFLLMGDVNSNRKTAEAFRKTLQQLESDPTVDSTDPAFVHLKCALLQRMNDYPNDPAETRARIHLVDSPEAESPEAESPELAEMSKPDNF
jgi:hypothetical protein